MHPSVTITYESLCNRFHRFEPSLACIRSVEVIASGTSKTRARKPTCRKKRATISLTVPLTLASRSNSKKIAKWTAM